MLKTFKKLSTARQHEIIDTTAEVFAENGYHGTSIPSICERTGISVGALYKYFKNKEDIYVSVLQRGIDIVENDLYSEMPEGETIYDALNILFNGLLPFYDNYRQYIILYIDAGTFSMNQFSYAITDRLENLASTYHIGLVDKYKAMGSISPDIDSAYVAYFIDTYLTLFSYSLVSEYYRRRFDLFFGIDSNIAKNQERIEIILKSLRLLLE
jgi:AcrR family transcriptional regulator